MCNKLEVLGEIANVEGSPFDFRKPASIGSRIESTPDRRGYDHNYVLSVPKDAMHGTLQLISRYCMSLRWEKI